VRAGQGIALCNDCTAQADFATRNGAMDAIRAAPAFNQPDSDERLRRWTARGADRLIAVDKQGTRMPASQTAGLAVTVCECRTHDSAAVELLQRSSSDRSATGIATDRVRIHGRFDEPGTDELVKVSDVEADVTTNLIEADSPLRDESADESNRRTKPLCGLGHVNQRAPRSCAGRRELH
jgi:hypothetical protein